MSKAARFLALVLCILLAGGLTAAHAEMVTVGNLPISVDTSTEVIM